MLMDQATARVLTNYENITRYVLAACSPGSADHEPIEEPLELIKRLMEGAREFHRATERETEPRTLR